MTNDQASAEANESLLRRFVKIENASDLATVLSVVVGVVWFGIGVYQRYMTDPVSGYVDTAVPTSDQECAVYLRQYHVYNPGPGNLTGIALEVNVRDVYNSTNDSFGSGLKITDGPGVTRTTKKSDGGARVRFEPSGGALSCWQEFWCRFHIRADAWSSDTATTILPGSCTYQAQQEYKQPAPSTSRLLWPGILIALSIAMWVLNHLRAKGLHDIINAKVDDAVEKARANIVAQVTVDNQQTLDETRLDRLPPPSTSQQLMVRQPPNQ